MIRASKFAYTWEQVWQFYTGITPILGVKYKSPFRKDKNPSCSFWVSPSGGLFLKDFATGETFDGVKAVMLKRALSYGEALRQIEKDAHEFTKVAVIQQREEIVSYQFVEEPLSTHYSYWKQYKIPIEIVERYTKVARTLYKNESYTARSTKTNPIFVYQFESGNTKIYRPNETKEKKWRSNTTWSDIGGWRLLPKKGKLLIVTSSIKDVMVFNQHGFNAIAFGGESYGTDIKTETGKEIAKLIKSLKKRFNYVVLFLDNDDAGISASNVLSRLWSVQFTTTSSNQKDPSDFQRKYGEVKTFIMIKKRLVKCLRGPYL